LSALEVMIAGPMTAKKSKMRRRGRLANMEPPYGLQPRLEDGCWKLETGAQQPAPGNHSKV
jgi:hypothetical protein